MGKKGYNWKARQVVNTTVDDSKTKAIQLDIKADGHYDASNELVLPSDKRRTKIKRDKTAVTKILTNKHRKKLEKIVERKKKKENRAALLEALTEVRATPEELSGLTSIASVQTKGLKRYFQEQKNPKKQPPKSDLAILSGNVKLNSLSGAKRMRLALLAGTGDKSPSDPNVVGFDSSSEDDEDESAVDDDGNGAQIDGPDAIEGGLEDDNSDVDQNKVDAGGNENDGGKRIISDHKCAKQEKNSKKRVNGFESVDCGAEKPSCGNYEEPLVTNVSNNSQAIKNDKKIKTVKSNKVLVGATKTGKIDTCKNSTQNIAKEIINCDTNKDKNKNGNSGDHTSSKTDENEETDKSEIKTEIPTEKPPLERKPAVFVEVDRCKEIQKARLKLPILAEEQQIMEIINENSVIIIAGETGSGKTTQVPQFLYEAGYALNKMIAVTEPRRVAAISMSQRVGLEMNLTSREVSYLIRFDGNATEDTRIKFMTDGVLLREIRTDFLLTKYSVVILDEAHERSVYTDILIGLLSRVVPLRRKRGDPLKLIVMSATLRLEDFTDNQRLFKNPPPVVRVEARQFPVTVHFNKRTPENYLREAYRKAVKVHTKLPEGGMLIFVTGQQEVKMMVRKLRRSFPVKHKSTALKVRDDLQEDAFDDEIDDGMKRALKKRKKYAVAPKIDLDDFSVPGDTEDPDLSEDEKDLDLDLNDDSDFEDDIEISNAQPLWVLPLYSLLPSAKQAEVFKPSPPGCRLCVVSTNVAETSLTIPNVKYVVDTGKTKVRLYDKTTGVSSYMVTWTSKASADQRAGRAGRTGPGHCYRLYSSAVLNDTFVPFDVPEIQRKPVDDLYLQMKCMSIDKVANFPFPTAPDLLQLKTAEDRLQVLGALKEKSVTPLGRAISKFPVLPRFGKMLALSHQQGLLPYTVCMVAALSVQEVLLEVPILHCSQEEVKRAREKWAIIRREWGGTGNSLLLGDPMVLLRAVGAAEYANSEGKLDSFCNENGLRQKAVVEIRKLRIQLTNEIKMNIPEADVAVDPRLQPPTDLQAKLLRQILLSGMGDQVAKKVMPDELKENEDRVTFKYAYKANNMEDPVYLHQGSVLKRSLPEFVVYQEIYETNKMYMRGVTVIEPEWLPKYVPHLCNLSEPLMDPAPRYDVASGKIFCTVSGTFGPQAWSLPNVEIEFPRTANAYKWFARFLLEGKVFGKLGTYTGSLLSVPSTMVKAWAKLQPRTDAILKALIASDVLTKDSLSSMWEQNPRFLLAEYLKWLPESAHTECSLLWPPLG